jgi:exopolysaccharide biosynthesis polyprenyl glycosylphosphotransferase
MVAVDALIIFDAFSVAYLLRFKFHFLAVDHFEPAAVDEYVKAMVVVAYFWILLFYVFGLYDLSRNRSSIDIFHIVVKAVTFGTLIILSLTYFYREFSFSRLVCIYAWLLSVVLFSAFRVSVQLVRSEWFRRGRHPRNVMIVGSRTLAHFLVDKIRKQPELGYRIVGLVDSSAPTRHIDDCPFLGTTEELSTLLDRHAVDGVLIAHPALGQFELLEIIQICEQHGTGIRMVPATFDLLVNYRDFEEVDGMPLVRVNEQEFRRLDEHVKRGMDLVLGLLFLVASLPIWAILATLIKLEDGGPVFFRQARVGKDGRPFRMWKLRTMVVNAEELLPDLVEVGKLEEPVFKIDADPRVTRIGTFLRRSSLDELPQLLNVLVGEMSLVGPRPEEERLVRLYNVWERRRLKARPGITGLQQVTCRAHHSLRERLKWDVLYLRKRSVLLDIWIIIKTVGVVISGKGAH